MKKASDSPTDNIRRKAAQMPFGRNQFFSQSHEDFEETG
jgi:hypothetical protein